MENLLGEIEPSLIDGGTDTGTPTADEWEIKKTKIKKCSIYIYKEFSFFSSTLIIIFY